MVVEIKRVRQHEDQSHTRSPFSRNLASFRDADKEQLFILVCNKIRRDGLMLAAKGTTNPRLIALYQTYM